MTRSPALPRTLALIAPLYAIAGGLAAQESTALPGTADACRAIASDAARLACYDAVYGRDADHTRDADQQARAAEEQVKQQRAEQRAAALPPGRPRRKVGHGAGEQADNDPGGRGREPRHDDDFVVFHCEECGHDSSSATARRVLPAPRWPGPGAMNRSSKPVSRCGLRPRRPGRI